MTRADQLGAGQFRPGRFSKREDGTASAELVVLVIPLMVLMAFAVFVGRYSATSQEVSSAARDAVRAAAVTGTPAAAQAAAVRAADESLSDRAVSCRVLDTTVDASRLVSGGEVTVEVACTVGLDDIAGFGMPGTRVVSASSSVVVDTYRGGDPP